jgi:hypothetical protein
MRSWRRAAVWATSGTAVAIVAAGVPASASVHSSGMARTGPETVSGAVYGKAALANVVSIPVALTGLVKTSGFLGVNNNSNARTHTVTTKAGNLVVRATNKPTQRQSLNPTTCRAIFIIDGTFKVLGAESTGAFTGASGPGAFQVRFGATLPRYASGVHKGQCNSNAQPEMKGALEAFVASVVLTTR